MTKARVQNQFKARPSNASSSVMSRGNARVSTKPGTGARFTPGRPGISAAFEELALQITFFQMLMQATPILMDYLANSSVGQAYGNWLWNSWVSKAESPPPSDNPIDQFGAFPGGPPASIMMFALPFGSH